MSKTTSKPKLLSINTSAAPRNGIVLYARVESASRPGHEHIVTKNSRGVYRCSCEPGMFNPKAGCDHIDLVKKKERS